MNTTSASFDITTEDYERKRHVFEMFTWMNETLLRMEQTGDFDAIYFERKNKNKNVKNFIEELMPIVCLGLHTLSPRNDVFLQCLAGNQPFDGILQVRGFTNKEIRIEVTTIETEDSTLRRQSLSRLHFAWSTGPIKREGQEIKSEPEMVNVTKQEQNWVDLALERMIEKLRYNAYGANTAILVSLDLWGAMSLHSRADLVHKTKLHFLEHNPEIYGVYYCDVRRFLMDEVLNDGTL